MTRKRLQTEFAAVLFNGTDNHRLLPVLPPAKEGFVHLHNAEQLAVLEVFGQVLPKPPVPSPDGGVAGTR